MNHKVFASVLVLCMVFIGAKVVAAGNAAISDKDFLKLCESGRPEEIASAIAGGANVNARDDDGATALMAATFWNNNPQVSLLLIKEGADVNAQSMGRTVLMLAAYGERSATAAALLSAGAKVNVRDEEYGMTALMWAATDIISENPDIIAILLDAGADANIRSNDGKRAIDYADKNPDFKKHSDAYRRLKEAGNK
jgi:ankyrin repeat protein